MAWQMRALVIIKLYSLYFFYIILFLIFLLLFFFLFLPETLIKRHFGL